jgi:predicted helicase
MQPLKNKEEVAVIERGKQVLQLLRAHASSFSEQVQALSSAAEECEREVEQEQEVEQEMEQEVYRARTVERRETNWDSWEEALQGNTLQNVVGMAARTKVRFHELHVCYGAFNGRLFHQWIYLHLVCGYL